MDVPRHREAVALGQAACLQPNGQLAAAGHRRRRLGWAVRAADLDPQNPTSRDAAPAGAESYAGAPQRTEASMSTIVLVEFRMACIGPRVPSHHPPSRVAPPDRPPPSRPGLRRRGEKSCVLLTSARST